MCRKVLFLSIFFERQEKKGQNFYILALSVLI